MAAEIQVTASLQYTNAAYNIAAKLLSIIASTFDITGKHFSEGMMSVPTTAGGTAIPVTGLTSLGWAFFKNNDSANYVDIYTAVSGALFARLMPGECALFRFHPGVTAPAAIAHTLAVSLEYLILEI